MDEVKKRQFLRYFVAGNPGECWEWQGAFDPGNGYGYFIVNRKKVSAHRTSYELFVGPFPAGLVTDHLCRNIRCVNPEHLEAVTDAVNTLRGEGPTAKNARKTHCDKGHELNASNTYIDNKRGSRLCRICRTANRRKYTVSEHGREMDKKRNARRRAARSLLAVEAKP